MSMEALLITFKLGKSIITPTEKLFLLSCARRAGEDHTCWPSIKRMSEDTGFDRKTIIAIRNRLIEKKLLRYTGEMKGRSEQIPVMQLTYIHEDDPQINRKPEPVDFAENSQSTSPNLGTGETFTSTKTGTGTSTKTGTLNNKEENKRKDNKTPYVDFKKSTEGKSYLKDELFMRFYSVYPRKQKPSVAYKSFLKHKPDEEFVDMLVADVQKRIENNWFYRDKSKIPFPATYLNHSEWEGEISLDDPQDVSPKKIRKAYGIGLLSDDEISWR